MWRPAVGAVVVVVLASCGGGDDGALSAEEGERLYLEAVREHPPYADATDADLLKAGEAACSALEGGAPVEAVVAAGSDSPGNTRVIAAAVIGLCPEFEDDVEDAVSP